MALFIGLMSGTSLDGVDGILASFPDHYKNGKPAILAAAEIPFDPSFRETLLSLQKANTNEIEKEELAANQLATLYAKNVHALLEKSGTPRQHVRAIGVHGQTIRHRPDLGFTRQTNNPALLAEMTGIDVIADFRRRDIAAGGQGAPLVPAFHMAFFGDPAIPRVILNIGGIANISILKPDSSISGFDTGPGNMLLDSWIQKNKNLPYDTDGNWAKSGTCSDRLLKALLSDPYFKLAPPKSTGRDFFNIAWLENKLAHVFPNSQPAPENIQATLAELTAYTIIDAIQHYAKSTQQIYVCGGGAKNRFLMACMEKWLRSTHLSAQLATSNTLGIDPMHVESLAFAWLAYRFTMRLPGNLPSVTGAKGPRILGALYPA